MFLIKKTKGVLKATIIVVLCFLSGCNYAKEHPVTDRGIIVTIEKPDFPEDGDSVIIQIANNSEKVITDWEIVFDCSAQIEDVIDCTFQQKGRHCIVYSSVYNHAILPKTVYSTTVVKKNSGELKNIELKGLLDEAEYVEAFLTNEEYSNEETEGNTGSYYIDSVFEKLSVKSGEVVFTEYEVRNTDNEVFKKGQLKDNEINDTGLDIGFNEIKLVGYLGQKKVISYIRAHNMEEENAIRAGFDLEIDNDHDGLPDHFERRMGFDKTTKYSDSINRSDYEVLFRK